MKEELCAKCTNFLNNTHSGFEPYPLLHHRGYWDRQESVSFDKQMSSKPSRAYCVALYSWNFIEWFLVRPADVDVIMLYLRLSGLASNQSWFFFGGGGGCLPAPFSYPYGILVLHKCIVLFHWMQIIIRVLNLQFTCTHSVMCMYPC